MRLFSEPSLDRVQDTNSDEEPDLCARMRKINLYNDEKR